MTHVYNPSIFKCWLSDHQRVSPMMGLQAEAYSIASLSSIQLTKSLSNLTFMYSKEHGESEIKSKQSRINYLPSSKCVMGYCRSVRETWLDPMSDRTDFMI